ncbi:hypothetical protein [Mariniflexile sp. AS56]|uniref:hypothetical protein n=1 Tax=Mariniflexile sp. AS56 TaxID=3063957 RepID=UPI0026F342E4|nr:hypothetical protein [Mariniflexile sp. AS56]MDO7171354.1 hypothetical protein [Mariniflexile sp. AS56]
MTNVSTNLNNKGIGSFFAFVENHDKNLTKHKTVFSPENKMLFYTGRQAIKYLIELIRTEQNAFTIWLPEYYCMHVTEWLKSNYSNIETYKTNPSNPKHIINAFEFASKKDVIIINNFWGVSECLIDTGGIDVITIEDHSHGWLSNSCINSKADFCMTSLRKSLPIPLGGMAWSPKNHELNKSIKLMTSESYEPIWDKTLTAMVYKNEYEKTGNLSLKKESLLLIKDAELNLHKNYNLTSIQSKHEEIINKFLPINYLEFKSENIKELHKSLQTNQEFEIIDTNTSTTFGLILHFKESTNLDKIRTYLIDNNIYPSLLWPGNINTYGYYLNIHLDYRYTKKDMLYIANVLNKTDDTLK